MSGRLHGKPDRGVRRTPSRTPGHASGWTGNGRHDVRPAPPRQPKAVPHDDPPGNSAAHTTAHPPGKTGPYDGARSRHDVRDTRPRTRHGNTRGPQTLRHDVTPEPAAARTTAHHPGRTGNGRPHGGGHDRHDLTPAAFW